MSNLFAQINDIDVNQLVDMTETKTGGGSRGLLPTGTAIVRLSTYVEFGKHVETFAGQAKPPTLQFKLGFRIVGGGGKNKEGKGEKYVQADGNLPYISDFFDTAMSQHEKSKAVKYFNALNRVGNKATHFVQKVAEQCLYTVPITVVTKAGKEYNHIDFSNLQPALNSEFEEYANTDLPQLKEEHIQVFLWDSPTKEMWDSIEIKGQWEARTDDSGAVISPAKSKNFLQEKCIAAIDFEGSPLELLLQEQGASYTIPELPTTPDASSVPDVPEVPTEAKAEGTVIAAPELDQGS